MILLNDLIDSTNKNLPQGAQVLSSLNVFAVFPIGLSLLIMGLAYFYFYALRRLPTHEAVEAVTPRTTEAYFERLYGRSGELVELRVYPDSAIVGLRLGEVEQLPGAPLFLAMKSDQETRLAPPMDELVNAGSVFAVMAHAEEIEQFAQEHGLGVLPGKHHLGALFDPVAAGVSEAVLPPSSGWLGKTAQELRIRKRYGMNLLAIIRAGETFRTNVRQKILQSGDTLIFHSRWKELSEKSQDRDFVVITDYPKEEPRPHKQGFAVFFFVGAFALAFVGHVALPIALISGAVGMLVTGVIAADEAYRAINWKTIFSLACLIPISVAIDQTGTAAWLAGQINQYVGGLGPITLQIMLAIVTTAAAVAMGHVGATVLMVPIGINLALAVKGSPTAFALIVSICASNNFFNSSNPVIAMIQGPGGYSKRDFARIGMPLSVAVIVVSVIIVNALYR